MPNIKSSINRVIKTEIQTKINRLRKNKYKSAVRQMVGYITASKVKEAENFLPKLPSKTGSPA